MQPSHPASIIQVLIPLVPASPRRCRNNRSPRSPRMRRRFAYTACCSRSCSRPPLPPSVRFRTVGAHTPLRQFAHHRAAMIALVGDFTSRGPSALTCFTTSSLLASATTVAMRSPASATRLLNRSRVALISPVQRGPVTIAPCLHVHRVLGLVRKMRATVLHLRDAQALGS